MKKILIILLLLWQTAVAQDRERIILKPVYAVSGFDIQGWQSPINGYTRIAHRYQWIAGVFDSTFHIPSGATTSLRTGGYGGAGGLFYRTTDSSLYTYTGTQWILVRGASAGGSPAGNYGNLQLNRNGSLATPASDSLDFDGGIVVKGTATVTGLATGGAAADSIVVVTSAGLFKKRNPADFGGSIPALISVTAVGNTTDSVESRIVTALNWADSLWEGGDSQVLGLNLGESDKFSTAIEAINDWIRNSNGFSGRGAFKMIKESHADLNPGHRNSTMIMSGTNDIGKGAASTLTKRKMINGLKAHWVNANLDRYTAGSSSTITKTAGWANFNTAADSLGGKATGTMSATINDTLTYTFTGPDVTITVIGSDGTKYSHTDSFKVVIDGTVIATNSTNFQTDNINDNDFNNGRMPMAFIYTGLSYGEHTLRIINRENDTLMVDYIGHLRDRGYRYPQIWCHTPYMTSTGYTSYGAGTVDADIDAVNDAVDSLVATLPTGHNVYVARVNDYLTRPAGIQGDGVHVSAIGADSVVSAIVAVFPYKKMLPGNDGTYVNAGRPFVVRHDKLVDLAFKDEIPLADTGVTASYDFYNRPLFKNNLSIGISGDQSVLGSTTSGGDLYLKPNLFGNGAIKFFNDRNSFDVTTGFLLFNKTSPGATIDIVTQGVYASSPVINIRDSTGFTGNNIAIYANDGSTRKFMVHNSGGISTHGVISSYAAGGHFHYDGGSGYVYLDNYNGSTFGDMRIRMNALEFQPGGSTKLTIGSNGLAKYAANYGSLYDARTLVDKNYVDSSVATAGGGGAFTDLSDVPSSYTGHANKLVFVNSGETGLTFVDTTGLFGGGGGGGANTALSNLASVAINTSLLPGTSDGAALGSTTKQWSDLFLAATSVINWDNGDITLTEASDVLSLAGATRFIVSNGEFQVLNPGVSAPATHFNESGGGNNYISTPDAGFTRFRSNSTAAIMNISGGATVQIGSTTASAKLSVRSTTEQFRPEYDATNYMALTIGSTGNATLNLVGTAPKFTFSDPIIARLQLRSSSTASTSSLTIDADSYDEYYVTALAANLTINAPSGTHVDGDVLMIYIEDNGTSRTLTWNAVFVPYGVTLPASTTISKGIWVGCKWFGSAYHVLSVNEEN